MTKPLYKTKSFWLVVAALLLIANCAVVWLMGTVKSAETTTTLWIGGTSYTTSTSGTGWSWNASTNTLTLKNCNISAYNQQIHPTAFNSYSIIAAEGNLNLVVEGSNTLHGVLFNYGGNASAQISNSTLLVSGKLTISGSGSLTITSCYNNGFNANGIKANSVEISGNCTLNVAGGTTREQGGYSGTSQGIVTADALTIKGNAKVTATGGATNGTGTSYGIFCATSFEIQDNAYVKATGGAAEGTGRSDGIYVGRELNVRGTATADATGGTATGGSSAGIRSAAGWYVRLYSGTMTATGGVAAASGQYSCGIEASGVELGDGIMKTCGGTLGASANAAGIRLIDISESSRPFLVKGGNLYASAAGTSGVSYGIWRGYNSNDNCNFRVQGGVVRAEGATSAVVMPSGTKIDGDPDRYSIYGSTVYGTKGTTATAFDSYSINSGHKRVDIEPTGYIGYSVPYLDANGVQQRCYVARSIESANTGTGYKFGDSGKTTWYAVTGNTTISSVSRAMGDAHLILCDGQTLNCTTYGIQVLTDENKIVDSLTIYSQSLGSSMGTLNATNSIREGEKYNGAAIGGAILLGVDSSGNSGTVAYNGGNITINGGNINAHGGVGAAGIGGCYLTAAGEITINNGIVYADGGHFSAGIGGGDTGTATSITINGGRVTSIGHGRAAGIGGGGSGWHTTPSLGGGVINITGGYVVANGGVGYNNSPEYNNPNTSGFQPRRIPTAIGDGIGNSDTSIEGVKAQVTISNAIVAVDRQHKTNVLGEKYYTISNNVFYIEDFYNMYDRTYDFTTETWSEEHVPNYQVVLYPRSGGNVYYLPQDINLPANMTLTLQSGQSIDANGHTFTNGGKILVEEGGIVTDVIRNGNIYYEIVYKSTIGADKISLARNDGLVVNGCSFTETRNDPNSTRDFTTTVTPTNVREFGIPGKTIQVNPAAGSFMRFDTSPATTVRPITNSSARQFTMPSQVTTLINPRQTLFFGGDGIINKGEIYTDMSGSTTSIDLLANGSFTTRFTPHYFYSGVNFVFDPGLPAGTKLVLMDRSKAVQGKGMVYSYTTTAASTTTIPASSFTLMKDGSPLSTADVTVNAESATVFQLSVELPDKNIAAGTVTYTVTMQDGGSPTKEVKAVCATYNPGTLTLTLPTVTPGAFTTIATVGNVIGDGNVLAVELLSGSGSVISLPAGTQITVDGKLPVEYANDRYYFSGIASGKHTISLANMVGGTYQVRAYLCESPRTPAYPMMESITTATTASATVPAIPADAVKLTSDDRVIDKALGESGLTLTLTTSASTTATLGTPVVHVQSSDGNFTAAAGITVTRTDTGYSVSAASAHEGLYRITLTYGDATTYFYFIVAI